MRKWVSWFLRQPVVGWFIPERLAQEEGVEAHRARLLVAFAYGLTVLGVGFSTAYAFVEVPVASIAAVVGAIFIFSGPALMRVTGSVRWGAHMSGLFLFLTIFAISAMTGGIRAPGVMWFTIVPTFGLVFGGFGAGVVWCGIVGVTCLAYYATVGVPVQWISAPVTGSQWAMLQTLAVIGLSLVILVLFTLHRWLHQKLNAELQQARTELERQAYYDRLTELPNRELLYHRLRHSIENYRCDQDSFAFLFIDLDDFKAVNDSLGHTTGDQVMKMLANRLERSVRDGDLVARAGGDEFVGLFESVDDAEQVEVLVEDLCQAFEQPIQVGAEEIHLAASIGVARSSVCCDPDAGPDRNIEIIRRTADRAMYRAKERTGTTVEFVGAEDRVESSRRIQRENRIRRGIEENEFKAHYQPIIRLSDGECIGAEVLARWEHPERGLLLPDDFLPIIERRVLIYEFGLAVADAVLSDLQDAGDEPFARDSFLFHLNLSPQQVADSDHMSMLVDRLMEESGEDVEWRLEITESQWVQEELSFEPLRRDQIGLVIDDFGKGYSSLGRLADMPCDGIKLDRQFVYQIDEEPDHQALVQIVASLGELLEVPVVAEGVESEPELQVLEQAGVTAAQGYYFARPESFQDLKARLQC